MPTSGEVAQLIYPHSDGQPMADNTTQFRWIVTIQGGERFATYVELLEQREQERQRAEQERQRAEQAEQLVEMYRRRFGDLEGR